MKDFATVMCMAFAATALAPSVRPPAVAEETKAEMARYGAVFSRGQSPVDVSCFVAIEVFSVI